MSRRPGEERSGIYGTFFDLKFCTSVVHNDGRSFIDARLDDFRAEFRFSHRLSNRNLRTYVDTGTRVFGDHIINRILVFLLYVDYVLGSVLLNARNRTENVLARRRRVFAYKLRFV